MITHAYAIKFMEEAKIQVQWAQSDLLEAETTVAHEPKAAGLRLQ